MMYRSQWMAPSNVDGDASHSVGCGEQRHAGGRREWHSVTASPSMARFANDEYLYLYARGGLQQSPTASPCRSLVRTVTSTATVNPHR